MKYKNTLSIPDLLVQECLEKFKFLNSNDVVYIRGDSNSACICMKDENKIEIRQCFSKLAIKMTTKGFINISDRVLVNLEHVEKLVKEDFSYHIKLKSLEKLSITQVEAKNLLERLILI